MRYFRSNKDTGFHYSSRPAEDNNVMMTYINNRWNTNDNIGRGVMIDNIFMGVSISILQIYKKRMLKVIINYSGISIDII